MEQETVSIIVTPLRYPHPTKGAVCQCNECHTKAWVSDTSIDSVKESMPGSPMKYICIDCFLAFSKQQKAAYGDKVKILDLTKAQIDEIKVLNENSR